MAISRIFRNKNGNVIFVEKKTGIKFHACQARGCFSGTALIWVEGIHFNSKVYMALSELKSEDLNFVNQALGLNSNNSFDVYYNGMVGHFKKSQFSSVKNHMLPTDKSLGQWLQYYYAM